MLLSIAPVPAESLVDVLTGSARVRLRSTAREKTCHHVKTLIQKFVKEKLLPSNPQVKM